MNFVAQYLAEAAQVAARIDTLSLDDADRILDPGMRSVYKQSRKKATA